MKASRVFVVIWTLVLLASVTWGLSAQETISSSSIQPPDDPDKLLFYFDFSGAKPGEFPEGLSLSEKVFTSDFASIEIIEDDELPTGKALRMTSQRKTEGDIDHLYARFPVFPALPNDEPVIAIEYLVKVISGTAGMYNYFQRSGHRLILLPRIEEIMWHAPNYGMRVQSVGAFFDEGWNRVRIVADRRSQTATLYLNDMETPIAEGLPFHNPISTWEGLRISLMIETYRPDHPEREVHYGEFKAWIVE